ncbi:MAG: heme A synthase, partial [Synechococcaceae bacterium WBB_3_034]|nr:heme A synthase [Synechococcaceae bacterium WBB_3_034]
YGSLLPGGRMNMQVFLEWFHRLDAFVVGVALLVLCAVSILQRRRLPGWVPWLGAMALVLVAIQGGLGAITVLALLPSVVVTAHLAMALLLVAVISAASQQLLSVDQPSRQARGLGWIWVVLASLSLVAVLAQCLLGGAMATQWAAERCLASGQDCQWLTAHRHLGSFAAVAVAVQAVAALRLPVRPLVRGLSLAAAGLVLGQLALGLSSWHLQLTAPLVTVAHQVVAALLVAVLTAGVSREVAHG